MEPSRRLVRCPVSMRVFATLLGWPARDAALLRITTDLPEDAQPMKWWFQETADVMWVFFSSASFREVPLGEEVPEGPEVKLEAVMPDGRREEEMTMEELIIRDG